MNRRIAIPVLAVTMLAGCRFTVTDDACPAAPHDVIVTPTLVQSAPPVSSQLDDDTIPPRAPAPDATPVRAPAPDATPTRAPAPEAATALPITRQPAP